MKRPISIFTHLFLGCIILMSFNLTAQPLVTTVKVSGASTRALLNLPTSYNIIQLSDLQVGATYQLIFNGAHKGQTTRFTVDANYLFDQPEISLERMSDRKNAIRFTAPQAEAFFWLTVSDTARMEDVPVYASIKCESCLEENERLNKIQPASEQALLSVTTPVSAVGLVTNTLIGGNCYQVSNITSEGANLSRGTFSNGGTNIGLESGIVLSSGSVAILPGPNNMTNANGGFNNNSVNDPDLATITNDEQYDVSKIEFDFTPTASAVQFDFVFGSEEHCEYANSQFNDVFGFFISGPGITGVQNIAVIPSSSSPITTNNINYNTNSNFYINNNNSSNCQNIPAAALAECQLDGWTQVFSAIANVIPCSTYHIKLAIADVSDGLFSSAVFLRANSFNAGGNVISEIQYPVGQPAALEGCGNGKIKFTRSNNDASQPLVINYTVGGTATPGLDYVPLPTSVVIPANQTSIEVPVSALSDNFTEGIETILLTIDNACSCTQSQLSFQIDDKPALNVSLNNQTVCQAANVTLTPSISGGLTPLSYAWNLGQTSASININPTFTSNYTVTVTDGCGEVKTASALIIVSQPTTVTDSIELCPGVSWTLNGVSYQAPNTVIDTIPGQGGACDTIKTYQLLALPFGNSSQQVSLCPGESINISGILYQSAGTVVDTVPGPQGECLQIITYNIAVLPNPTLTVKVQFCPGEIVNIGGNTYTTAGVYLDTIPSSTGCDTLATYIIESLTPAPSTVQLTCPGNISVITTVPTAIQFSAPTANSDCICPGMDVLQTSGLPSGSVFPLGQTAVCYTAADKCGNTASCCFNVLLNDPPPCDIKVIGCMKYELLSITQDPIKRTTYRVRVTNNCTNKLVYSAFQIPNGTAAFEPGNLSTYYAPSGRPYAVRNPNFSPFYSIRFFSNNPGISGGESDIFKYTLPPVANLPAYVHVTSKVAVQEFFEAYLNTFFCPIGVTPLGLEGDDQTEERQMSETASGQVRLLPNPVESTLWMDLSAWNDQPLQLQVIDAQGRRLKTWGLTPTQELNSFDIPVQWSNGLYLLQVLTPDGNKQTLKFIVQH